MSSHERRKGARSTEQFRVEEEAATATEYAVMLALIIMTCISAIGVYGNTLQTMFVNIESTLFAA